MSCRDVHATNAFAFIIGMLSVGGLTVATLIPQWRTTRLLTYNLDLDLLQFCLPAGLLFSSLALLLCLTGMCKTACCSKTPDDIKNSHCLVNSSGCHLLVGMLLFLGGAIAMLPSVWFLFHTRNLNERYDNLFAVEFGVYVAISSAGGLILAALLMFMWYCMCKKLPSPFWLPLPEGPAMTNSLSVQPLMTNGLPSPMTYAPQSFLPAVLDAPTFVPAQGYPQPAPTQPMPPHVYMPQMSIPDSYGSEVGASQAYRYTPSQTTPPQRYAGHRYSTRSRISGIEINIPVLTD
uniref:Claudin 12 n=1 Tax=Sinocyclocheilus grahami TaxID=75366 RepID=A0A672SXR1_SINGR